MRFTTLLALACAGPLAAGIITYDVTNDWSDSVNPNGAWRYKQGSTLLPHQSSFVGCFNTTAGITGGWAPGNTSGNCIPGWFKATGNAAGGTDWLTGDILIHSVDGANGNPAIGQADLTWTAPAAGTIAYSGAIWYAHSAVQRSNDFSLTLNSTGLASGTVAFNSGFTRSSPDAFSSGAPLSVVAGDVVSLTVSSSTGQTLGSLDGIRLTITETTSATVPEPASLLLFGLGGAALAALKWNRTRS